MTGTSDKIQGVANETVGKIKQGIGHVTGDTKLQVEGKVQEVKGDVQKAVGDVKTAAKHEINKAAEEANKKL